VSIHEPERQGISNWTFWELKALSGRIVFCAGVEYVGETIDDKFDGVTRTVLDELPSGIHESRSLNFIISGIAYWIGNAIILYVWKLFLDNCFFNCFLDYCAIICFD